MTAIRTGLCECGHQRLAHQWLRGRCQHTTCLKSGGCTEFRAALLTHIPDPLFVKGKNRGHAYITCGICGAKSYHTLDIENEYCSNCAVFFADLIVEQVVERSVDEDVSP